MNTQTAMTMDMMSSEGTGIPQEFLLKQLENEIKAGFVFLAAARKAVKRNEAADAEGALRQAAQTHDHVSKEVAESPQEHIRAVVQQLTELREAIDGLRESILNPTNHQ